MFQVQTQRSLISGRRAANFAGPRDEKIIICRPGFPLLHLLCSEFAGLFSGIRHSQSKFHRSSGNKIRSLNVTSTESELRLVADIWLIQNLRLPEQFTQKNESIKTTENVLFYLEIETITSVKGKVMSIDTKKTTKFITHVYNQR